MQEDYRRKEGFKCLQSFRGPTSQNPNTHTWYSTIQDTPTWSSGGTGPGSMLFMDEYSLGICLSRLHRTHSVSLLSGGNVLTFKPGNFSKHVIHLETCRAARCEWKFTILVQTVALSVSCDSVLFTSCCCLFRSLMGQSPLLSEAHLLQPGLSLVWSLMGQSPLLREDRFLELGLSLIRSLMGQSPLLCEAHLFESSRSLVWRFRC